MLGCAAAVQLRVAEAREVAEERSKEAEFFRESNTQVRLSQGWRRLLAEKPSLASCVQRASLTRASERVCTVESQAREQLVRAGQELQRCNEEHEEREEELAAQLGRCPWGLDVGFRLARSEMICRQCETTSVASRVLLP